MILVHVVSSDQLERPDGSCNNQGLNSDNFQKPKDHTSLSFPISNLQQYIRILPFKEGTKGFFFLFSPVYSLCHLTALFRMLVLLLAFFNIHFLAEKILIIKKPCKELLSVNNSNDNKKKAAM